MNIILSISRVLRIAGRATAAALLLGCAFGSATALAAMPTAGETISNQARAVYRTVGGGDREVKSNEVKVTIAQVGSFTLDGRVATTDVPFGAKSAAPGGSISVAHTVKNTGNGSDDFTIAVKADAGAQFSRIQVFPSNNRINPLCASDTPGVVSCQFSASGVAAGGEYGFDVIYTLKADATPDASKATVTAVPSKPELYIDDNKSVSDTDQIDALGVRFAVQKYIGETQGAAPNNGSWPEAPLKGPASRTGATCATTWSTALRSTDTCQYTVFTLKVTNSGTKEGRFAMSDTLPTGMTYVAGSAVWSESPGVALSQGTSSKGVEFFVNGNTLNLVSKLAKGTATPSLSFVVLVNSQAVAGTTKTTNEASYSVGGVADTVTASSPGTLNGKSGAVAYEVIFDRVAFGAANGKLADFSDKTPGVPNDNVSDRSTQPSFALNGEAFFDLQLVNLSSGARQVSFDLSDSNFPAGTVISLEGTDGFVVGVGNKTLSLERGEPGKQGRFKVLLPNSGAADSAFAGPFHATITMKISNNAAATDATKIIVTAYDDPTKAVTLTPARGAASLAQGESVAYAHVLAKTGTGNCGVYTAVFELQESDKTAGWKAKVFLDPNQTGVLSSGLTELAAGSETTTALNGVIKQGLIVQVTAPANANATAVVPGSLQVRFTGNACREQRAIDTTTVVADKLLTITKEQAADESCKGDVVAANAKFTKDPLSLAPGQCILYRILATNDTGGAVNNVMITDTVPKFTTLITADKLKGAMPCKSSTPAKPITGTAVAYAADGTTVSCGSAANSMPSGGSLTLIFGVKINK